MFLRMRMVQNIFWKKNVLQMESFELHMQKESKLWPEYLIRSHTETYYQLRKTSGHHSSSVHNLSIRPCDCKSTQTIIGIDTDKRFRSKMYKFEYSCKWFANRKCKHAKTSASGAIGTDHRVAHIMNFVLHSDHILENHDTSVSDFRLCLSNEMYKYHKIMQVS